MKITAKRLVLFGLAAVGLFVAYFAYQLLVPSGSIQVSPQTTAITQPLADDGLPDYSAAVLEKMRAGATPETNGAIPYLQAMWPAELSEAGRPAVCRELGMDLPTTNGMTEPYIDKALVDYLTSWYQQQRLPPDEAATVDERALRDWVRNELIQACGERPWTAAQLPPLAEWLAQHESHFDLLSEAARRPHFYLPSETLLTGPNTSFIMLQLPHAQSLRSTVRCLALRANHYIGQGDLDGAWHDCQTMYELGDTCRQEFLVGALISMACEGIALRTTEHVLASPDLSEDLAEQIETYLSDRGQRDDVRPAIDQWERLLFVTAIIEMSGQRRSSEPSQGSMSNQLGPFAPLAQLAIDWNRMLTIGNQWYDDLIAALDQPTATQRDTAISAIEAKLAIQTQMTAGKVIGSALSRRSRTDNIAGILSNLFLPALSAANGAEYRANNLRRLHQVAAALAVQRVQTGSYPPSLDVLVPAHFDALPTDIYDRPLVYHHTQAGYLLYTLGANGNDDGGSHETRSLYKGYETADSIAADRELRALVGEPSESENEDDYVLLRAPAGTDDLSLRTPLRSGALPQFSPAD